MKFTSPRCVKKLAVIEAKNEKLRKIAYRLRYLAFKEVGYITDNHQAVHHKYFFDELDPYSTIFILFINKKPIGSIRITLAKNSQLEIERSARD